MNKKHESLKEVLRSRFGLEDFRPGQETAIKKVLEEKRVLLVQPTGWGKSLVYQMIAAIKGLTLVFSPLRALMRDQEREAAKYGLRAAILNSDMALDEQESVLQCAHEGKLDLLYIAPERLDNELWQSWVSDLPIRALVIDEAHCVSQWGHDFRPKYRRIIEMVTMLPPQTPVIAVTATATKRVEEDIAAQMGGQIEIIRGRLARPNFRLRVHKVNSEAEKLAHILYWVTQLPGTGIVYTATTRSAMVIAELLKEAGVNAEYYHGKLPAEARQEIEERLRTNAVKVVVATNALGMGINKPDIRYIIHAEIPGSLMAYYQEIGRAGRDGLPADIILLFDPSDVAIQEHFIETSKPSAEHYESVLELLHHRMLSQSQLLMQTGLSQTAVRTILEDLLDQGLVARLGKHYRATSLQGVDLSANHELRGTKLAELRKMLDYVETDRCRMEFLCRYLGDDTAQPCGQCDNCKECADPILSEELMARASSFALNPRLHLQAKWRGELVYKDGRALDYYAGTRVGDAIRNAKYNQQGEFPEWLVEEAAKVIRKHWSGVEFSGIVSVPPTRSGLLVKNFAMRLAKRIGVPYWDVVVKTRETLPQKEFGNRTQKRANLRGAFALEGSVSGNVLVVDDVADSGVTLEELGKVLRQGGADTLYALVLAQTRHSDDV